MAKNKRDQSLDIEAKQAAYKASSSVSVERTLARDRLKALGEKNSALAHFYLGEILADDGETEAALDHLKSAAVLGYLKAIVSIQRITDPLAEKQNFFDNAEELLGATSFPTFEDDRRLEQAFSRWTCDECRLPLLARSVGLRILSYTNETPVRPSPIAARNAYHYLLADANARESKLTDDERMIRSNRAKGKSFASSADQQARELITAKFSGAPLLPQESTNKLPAGYQPFGFPDIKVAVSLAESAIEMYGKEHPVIEDSDIPAYVLISIFEDLLLWPTTFATRLAKTLLRFLRKPHGKELYLSMYERLLKNGTTLEVVLKQTSGSLESPSGLTMTTTKSHCLFITGTLCTRTVDVRTQTVRPSEQGFIKFIPGSTVNSADKEYRNGVCFLDEHQGDYFMRVMWLPDSVVRSSYSDMLKYDPEDPYESVPLSVLEKDSLKADYQNRNLKHVTKIGPMRFPADKLCERVLEAPILRARDLSSF